MLKFQTLTCSEKYYMHYIEGGRKLKKLKMNYPLLIGSIIVVFVLFIAIYGEYLVPFDPYGLNPAKVFENIGDIKPNTPPNSVNIFGTDFFGRDIFSQILYGAKYTIFIGVFVVLFRLLVAIPIAFFAGFGGKVSSKLIDFFDKVFSTIPALLFSIFILSFGSIKNLELEKSMIPFIVVLTIVGWARLAKSIKIKIQDILAQDFIQGEKAIGKNKFLISMQNVLPHLLASIMVYSFLEMGRALTLLAQLGIFQVFVGSSENIFEVGDFKSSYDPEWGGLISSGLYGIMTKQTWIAIFPALAFFISILGFNLLGEGLRIEINKRKSKFISNIKKIPFHISPITFIHEIKNYKSSKKPIIIKTSLIIIFVIILMIPPPESLYKIDKDELFSHIEEFSKDKYEGRMLGTKGRDLATQYITEQLEKCNLKPLFGDNYTEEYESEAFLGRIKDSRIVMKDKSGDNIIELEINQDYDIDMQPIGKPIELSEVINGKILTVEQYNNREYDSEKKYILVADNTDLTSSSEKIFEGYLDLLVKASNDQSINGLVVPLKGRSSFGGKNSLTRVENPYRTETMSTDTIVFKVNNLVAQQLKGYKGKEFVLKNDIDYVINPKIKNIGAIIEGKAKYKKDPIVITTNYDYLGYEFDIKYKGLTYNATSVASMLEIAKGISSLSLELDRDIIFLFFDGSRYSNIGANAYIQQNFADDNGIIKNSFIIRLNYLGLSNSEEFFIDKSYARTSKPENFQYVKYIKKRAKQLDIDLKSTIMLGKYTDDDLKKIITYGGKGIILKAKSGTFDFGGEQKDFNLIDKEKLTKQTQLILDSIVNFSLGDN